MKKSVKSNTDDFYVGLNDPRQIRKRLLEGVRGLVEVLQSVEILKETRTSKELAIGKLKRVQKELSALLTQLKAELPKVNKEIASTFSTLKPMKKPESDGSSTEAQIVQAAEPPQNLTKLEQELKSIEEELEKLG